MQFVERHLPYGNPNLGRRVRFADWQRGLAFYKIFWLRRGQTEVRPDNLSAIIGLNQIPDLGVKCVNNFSVILNRFEEFLRRKAKITKVSSEWSEVRMLVETLLKLVSFKTIQPHWTDAPNSLWHLWRRGLIQNRILHVKWLSIWNFQVCTKIPSIFGFPPFCKRFVIDCHWQSAS